MSDTNHKDDIGCLEALEAFYTYLDGELDDPGEIADFEHHMSHCRSCYSRKDVESMLTKRMRESSKSQAPKVLQGRLRKLMEDFQDDE